MGQIKNIKLHIVTDIKISLPINMASVIKTMLVAFLIVSLVHLATAGGDDKCKGPSDTTEHCTGNNFDYKCIVTKSGDAADTPMGCVTDANKNTCNKNQTNSGVTVKTCCCSGELTRIWKNVTKYSLTVEQSLCTLVSLALGLWLWDQWYQCSSFEDFHVMKTYWLGPMFMFIKLNQVNRTFKK